ncbi:MAG: hypothetical protein FWB91_05755 [Defluviitaleaceae bacterium]|nr:hypothetical protein [Defluviitaleaceae bacterium]
MRIKVSSEDSNFNLRLPTRLFFNPITAAFCRLAIPAAAKQYVQIDLTYTQMRILFKEIRRCRKLLNGEPLVEVASSDGSTVRVWL